MRNIYLTRDEFNLLYNEIFNLKVRNIVGFCADKDRSIQIWKTGDRTRDAEVIQSDYCNNVVSIQFYTDAPIPPLNKVFLDEVTKLKSSSMTLQDIQQEFTRTLKEAFHY